MTSTELITDLYANFNARDAPAVLAHMAPEVEWPASTEGSGYVTGPDAIAAYWTRQWSTLDPHVTPQAFTEDAQGRIVVTVHQVVHDRAGTLLDDRILHHLYTFSPNGQIRRMDIEAAPPL